MYAFAAALPFTSRAGFRELLARFFADDFRELELADFRDFRRFTEETARFTERAAPNALRMIWTAAGVCWDQPCCMVWKLNGVYSW